MDFDPTGRLNDPSFPLVFVGGCVRDPILAAIRGEEAPDPHDIDFVALNATTVEEIETWVRARGGRIFQTGKHGICRASFPDLKGVDIGVPRMDIFGADLDGRNPDSIKPGTLLQDLARRDFTCNAIAREFDGTLIDPHDGRADMEIDTLRFVGDPEERLREDRLRAFRGFRFQITLGLTLDIDARFAIGHLQISDFDPVSTERMVIETHKAFAHDPATAMFDLVEMFPTLLRVMVHRGVWFEPTTKNR